MTAVETVEIAVKGMDCAECARRVQEAVAQLPGVESAHFLLSSEKLVVRLDPTRADLPAIRQAIERMGYSVTSSAIPSVAPMGGFARRMTVSLAVVFGVVLGLVVAGEWLGLFEKLNERIPFPVGLAIVIVGGLPIFRNVARAALRRQITSHTLMTLGAIAALAVGEWVAAAIVVVFMRVGDYVERLTAESARRAVRELIAMAPQTARVERDGVEMEVPASTVKAGEVVIVRPGERIPVDGEVIAGHAVIDQSAITGESMPVEVARGSHVFAATIVRAGSLRVKTLRVGADTTFGRVIQMVEEAEAHRADVQRLADRFSAYYLPIVVGIAAFTFLVSRNPLATAAVLVVACSCSFALATPVAMLASIGASARRGLLIKGGKHLETLARADVVLVDKTGTLTLGQPRITDVVSLNGMPPAELLALAASAERYSEHPLAEAVRSAARAWGLTPLEPEDFEALPGLGVRARVNGRSVTVGNRRLVPLPEPLPVVQQLEADGKTLLFVALNGEPAAILAAADTLRPEVPIALAELRGLGVQHIELLTGDNERAAAALARALGVPYRANLLPEDKIRVVKDYQAQGHTVVMIGDGVNDAPALAQADVGIAMGAAGSDIAIEAAHIALMREDWRLIPELFRIARRTMHVVRINLAFTAVYNLTGLALAALGILPPTLAAAAQSLPDLGILGNSSRLLRQGQGVDRG
ncbi:heavy metal translocating P-type ATPase [Thermoflexus sp.]|uniref:heavy metal translocating P-type ATPase n=1 Tax=Thermoflexus sp. TaxID=1969742 RepID=UPI0035E44B9F